MRVVPSPVRVNRFWILDSDGSPLESEDESSPQAVVAVAGVPLQVRVPGRIHKFVPGGRGRAMAGAVDGAS